MGIRSWTGLRGERRNWRQFSLGMTGALLLTASPASAMLVFDSSNFAQNLVTAIEAVDQTLQQIETYKVQLLQVQQMVRDGVADIVYTWDRMESIYRQVGQLDEQMEAFVDDIKGWTDDLRTREYYRTSPCYGSDLGCYGEAWDRTLQSYADWQLMTTKSQQKTLQMVMQQVQVEGETRRATDAELTDLQTAARKADGQWKAQQVGNMVAVHQARDLKALRALLVSQHNMLAVRWAVELEEQERQRALDEVFVQAIPLAGANARLASWPERSW